MVAVALSAHFLVQAYSRVTKSGQEPQIVARFSSRLSRYSDYALETLAEGDAVLVIDETGFLKQGKASCGSIPARRARSPTARSVSSPPMYRPGATPSSTGTS